MERKPVYFDPLLGGKQNAMLLRADIVNDQLTDKAARARDIQAAKEERKQEKMLKKALKKQNR